MDTKLTDEEIEEILNKIFKHQASKEENTDDEDNDEKERVLIIVDFRANFNDDEQRKIYSYLKSN